jgi:tRNA pseudouridine38/39 synthase
MKRLFENSTLNKYALKVCYLGFNYDGMACNEENDNSIEHFIFKALYCLSLTNKIVPAEGYTRAGRTDKGVSAMGNVISLPLR